MNLIAYYRGSASVPDQRIAVEGFCLAFGHQVVCEVVEAVADEVEERLGLEDAIRLAKQQRFGLIVASLEALGPGTRIVGRYADRNVELLVVAPRIRGWDAALVYLSTGFRIQRDLPAEPLSLEDLGYLNRTQGRCPTCQGGELLEGPHGRCAINAWCLRCGQEYCLFVNPLPSGPLVMGGEALPYGDDREPLYLKDDGRPRRRLLTDWKWRSGQ